MKITGVFLALLLVISGCGAKATPTTAPVKVESQQVKTPDQQTTSSVSRPVVAPTTTPTVTVAPAPTPAAPPTVTPTPAPKQTPQAVTS